MTSSNENIVLYYFPGSYYSQKALIALYEKDVQFNEKIIVIVTGEQNKESYRKVNKRGLVPTLVIDGEFFPESERIIEIVDEKFPQGPKLIPDTGTAFGDEVQTFRALLNEIPIDCITYGVICNQDLSSDRSTLDKFPPQIFSREGSVKRFSRELVQLIKIIETCEEEGRKELQSKMADITQRMDVMLNPEKVEQALTNLNSIFDKLEARLEQTVRGNPKEPGCYLFGPTFTAADITAAVLFIRLQMLGVTSRFFSDKKRPLVNDYYKKLSGRPSVKKIEAKLDKMMANMKMAVFVKSTGLKVLKFGLSLGLIGLGIYGVKEYLKRSGTTS